MKPNVLLIICDQLRKDCLGCYGNEFARTPNIDTLAMQSIVCDKNYVANPICTPNRMTLFSGMYPRNHGLWTNGLFVPDDKLNLMYHLKENGYQTANLGKIHFEPNNCDAFVGSKESKDWWENSPEAKNFTGPFRGFDYIQLANAHHGYSGNMKEWFFANGGTEEMFQPLLHPDDHQSGTESVPAHLSSTAFVGEKTVEYLEEIRNPRKPFFAVASFPDPHHPFIAPQECYDSWDGASYKAPVGDKGDLSTRPARYRHQLAGAWARGGLRAEKHPDGISESLAHERYQNTYAMIEQIDLQVGKILESLQKEGLDENTIVLFTSDHGELLGDFGLWLKGPFFFEGLISTPLIARIPNATPKRCDALISAVDFAPTICDLLQLDIPFYIDGISQKEVLLGSAQALRERCMIEYRNGYGKKDVNYKVLLDQNYKYIRDQYGEEELVDLKNDPEERHNLAQNPQTKAICNQYALQLLEEMLQTESKKPAQLCLA
ncbi:MAG: sulfatase-like hydrolase/transferase [Faecalibacterium sp.]